MDSKDYRVIHKTIQKPKKNKYRNRKVKAYGKTFDSRKEKRRWGELLLLEKAGQIRDLVFQPKFKFAANGVPITYDSGRQVTYTADSSYVDVRSGLEVVEDVKSKITAKDKTYRLKKALMRCLFGIEIKEV